MSLTALLQNAGLLGSINSEMSPPNTSPMEPSAPVYGNLSGPVDSSGFDIANRGLIELLANPPQMSAMPERVTPAFRTADAMAGGGGLLLSYLLGGKNEAAGFAQGYMGSKGKKADQETQTLLQNWQQQNQQNQANYQGKVSAAKYGADVEGDKLNRAYSERNRSETQADKNKAALEGQLQTLYRLYDAAKTKEAMSRYATQIAQIEAKLGNEVSTAPTSEDIETGWFQKSGQARDRIFDNWRQYQAEAKKGNYGTVDEAEARKYAGLKKSLEAEAKSYGLDVSLPEMETETTLQAKYMDELKSQAANRGVILKNNSDQNILVQKARIQRMREQTAMDRARVGIGQFNANTGRMNYELRQLTRQTNDKVKAKVDSIQAQINGEKAKLQGVASPSIRRKIQSKVDELTAERDYWKAQKEPEDFSPKAAGMTPDEASQKAQEIRDALAAKKITPEQAGKLFEYLNKQAQPVK